MWDNHLNTSSYTDSISYFEVFCGKVKVAKLFDPETAAAPFETTLPEQSISGPMGSRAKNSSRAALTDIVAIKVN
jgi:hypothetical protein